MKRILIVDDIEENLELQRIVLEGNGYEVEQAANGSEAITKALEKAPDMIISDILMPIMDGYTLCRKWKADERLKRVPFVLYTATYTDSRDERLALDMGADAFMVKPMETDEFMRQIETILNSNKDSLPALPNEPKAGGEAILKNYNETLIRKLEHKMLELEQTNKMLETEIASRKQAEEEITAALQEKNVLLKEIHHRVKNNMQIISSLIGLQMNMDITLFTPDKIIEIGHELQNRILSMALIHEMLYTSKNLSKIDFNKYIHNMIESLFISYNINSGQVTTAIEVTDKPVSITAAIPMGLIINELLTNALKYAFPDGKKGEIRTTMTIDDAGMCHVTVRDNGVGLPENFNIETAHTFGLSIISILIKQLDGSIQIRNDNGAAFTVQFREIEDDDTLSLIEKK